MQRAITLSERSKPDQELRNISGAYVDVTQLLETIASSEHVVRVVTRVHKYTNLEYDGSVRWTMQRRQFIAAAVTGCTFSLAGCGGNSEDDQPEEDPPEDDQPEEDPPEDDQPEEDPPEDDQPEEDPPEFEVSRSQSSGGVCDQGGEGAIASYNEMEISAAGWVEVPTLCFETQVNEIRYNEDEEAAEIVIEAVQNETSDCAMCEGAIQYSATIDVSNRMPSEARLIHLTPDGEETLKGRFKP